ncbi:MAG: DUF1194 domain-containing protein [Candidatus Kaistia colombiensis]|nr:MAG: DUF1194 domain-containing protein [Kaistia sp.]
MRFPEMLIATVMMAVAPLPARAQEVPVDLELILAVDVSRSMDADEQALQRQGYIAALHHPDVIAAIQSGPTGRIAIAYFEWSGFESQAIVVPWSLVNDAESADAVASRISPGEVLGRYGTSISGSLAFAAALFENNGYAGARRTIDISGDGPNNTGPPVIGARDAVVARGITINGLAITLKPPRDDSTFEIDHLDAYYRDCVIGGLGAFTLPVHDVDQFEVAIRRKLVTEIAARPLPILRVVERRPEPMTDCLGSEGGSGRTPR